MTKEICEHSGIEFETKDGWISVKDRFPENDDLVVVLGYVKCAHCTMTVTKELIREFASYSRSQDKLWLFMNFMSSQLEVHYWMPLPSIPEGIK